MDEKAITSRIQLDERNVKQIRNVGLWIIILLVVYYSLSISQVNFYNLFSGLGYTATLLGKMYPPDTKYADLSLWLSLSVETIAMGVVGTILGFILSFPVCFLAARNTTTGPIAYYITRSVVTFFRTFPDFVLALIFIVSFGMGPVPGILCLTLGTFGMLTKFYSEALESIDPKPVEALTATGSHKLGVIRHAVLPQVIPVFMSYTLYMVDSNIRTAMMLGIFGAGGLGIELYLHMEELHYTRVATILFMIVIMVALINRTSARMRKGIIDGDIFRGSRRRLDILIVLVSSIIAVISVYYMLIGINYTLLIGGISNMISLIPLFWPPDFSNLNLYITLMIQSIAMAIAGTAIAILLALPLGMLMARNLMKNKIVSNVVRECANLLRAIPEVMTALLFVAAVGMGPFAGVLAIALHTAGVLGEFYAGAFENMDPKPIEAVEATGATFIQRVRHVIIPQITPLFISNNLYILDRNIRASSILGMVGAGGVGFLLIESFDLFYFKQGVAIVIVMIVTIFVADMLSAYIRRKIV